MKTKIKKGDVVAVISGKDKGKQGRVIQIDRTKMRVTIEGVNIRKKHMRPSQSNPDGGIISMEMPIHYSNVNLLDASGKPTRADSKKRPVSA
ncbi:MAG: 50S ribosomal protein L24 [Candidatus Kapabacteria bacterium]|nr:50S ribosomal protein L24 [Candidatus Kapabacteria bacterium]